jgi:hypothetical protein
VASRISADLFLTRCGSHRELVAHRDQVNPTGSKNLASTRCWRVTKLRAEPGCASYGRDAGGEIKGGRPGGPSTDRRATRLFCILTKIQKSTGNVVALSALVRSESRDRRRPGRCLPAEAGVSPSSASALLQLLNLGAAV